MKRKLKFWEEIITVSFYYLLFLIAIVLLSKIINYFML